MTVMLAIPFRRITAVWLLLILATLFSWESAHVGHDHRLSSSIVLVVAFIKVRFVGLEFMELRAAPLPLRLIFEAWVVLACAALLILYWLSPSA
jgi:hypothetical protein